MLDQRARGGDIDGESLNISASKPEPQFLSLGNNLGNNLGNDFCNFYKQLTASIK